MNSVARMVAPIAVLILGIGLAVFFVRTAPKPKRKVSKSLAPMVEVVELQPQTVKANIEALGTVIPAQQVQLQPEVSGSVRFVHPSLKPGGYIRKGEVLVRLDRRNYQLTVQEREASVSTRQANLEMEQGQQRVAQKEWDLLKPSTRGAADERLALRKPQLENAMASLKAAEALLERAKLDLSRTVITAPFDALVQTEAIDLGQVVGPNSTIATLVGTNTFWVQVSIPVLDMKRVHLPKDTQPGSSVKIYPDSSLIDTAYREGEVVRVLGDLDPNGKMARLIVQVDDPLNLEPGRKLLSDVPLLIGTVAQVQIEGQSFDNVWVIPRRALHEDQKVWMVEGRQLAIRTVEVVWRGKKEVFVRAIPQVEPLLVVSRIAVPVDGMSVRHQRLVSSNPSSPVIEDVN